MQKMPSPAETLPCPFCQNANPTDAAFCIRCGGKLKYAKRQHRPSEASQTQKTVPPAPPTPPDPQPGPLPRAGSPQKSDAEGWDAMFAPIKSRADALKWIKFTMWVYFIMAAINLVTGAVAMTLLLGICAALLHMMHSRAIAWVLLGLSTLSLVVSFADSPLRYVTLTIVQIIITIRGLEATYKLRNSAFK